MGLSCPCTGHRTHATDVPAMGHQADSDWSEERRGMGPGIRPLVKRICEDRQPFAVLGVSGHEKSCPVVSSGL